MNNMFNADDDLVVGLGYRKASRVEKQHTRIYNKWRVLLTNVMDDSRNFNTLDISESWCCFDNFLEWFLKCEAALDTEKSCFVVFNAPELLKPKRRRVDGKMVELFSPKYSEKTCHLSIVKPLAWRGSRDSSKLVFDRDLKKWSKEYLLLKGTEKQAMQTRFPLPPGTKLFALKTLARKRYAKQGRSTEARAEQLKQERQATKMRVERRRNAKLQKKKEAKIFPGYGKRYSEIVEPAQAMQMSQIDHAPGEEKIRRAKAKTPEAAMKQAALFRGLGYIGVGPYVTNVKGKQTRAFKTYMELLKRCYTDCANRDDSDALRGYRMGKRFLNFQKFAKWFEAEDKNPEHRNLPGFEPKANSKGFLILNPKTLRLTYMSERKC